MHASKTDQTPPDDDGRHAARRGKLDTSGLDVEKSRLRPLLSLVLLTAVCLLYVQVWIWMFRGLN